ncbi:uncharacterized protein LOC134277022 [Saccostrea cucullata]|uniref:uncharacterized protein LOC134277022 n=1 Tax=Saccostrea cuccullata TaxID=36930 RepID=UPI002ED53ECD
MELRLDSGQFKQSLIWPVGVISSNLTAVLSQQGSQCTLFRLQYGCRLALQIPVADANGDILRCRWSSGSECVSVCSALPYASLNRETCTITFPSNHTINGTYAVAVTVEDFPRSNILIGGTTYTPSGPMTSVHLQFLVRTPSLSGGCDERPIFVNNTPPEGTIINVMVDQTLHISFYVASNDNSKS